MKRFAMDASVVRLAALGMVLALAATACGGAAVEEPVLEEPAAEEPAEAPPVEELAPGTIVTVFGSGDPAALGTEGVGGPATEAQLGGPGCALAFDAAGNLYIAERVNHRIVKVDPSGILTMVAGSVTEAGFTVRGFSGDGGPATEAELSEAWGVAVGPDGSLYIADTGNHRIRKVDQSGIITTVAGTGEAGYSGDGGAATEAALNGPVSLVFDAAGSLYVWDAQNLRIRKVDPEGIITTAVGTGEVGSSPDGTRATEASLGHPSDHCGLGLAFDGAGRLYLSDMGNNRIVMVDEQGLLETVAGTGESEPLGDGGPATEAGLMQPLDVAIGPDGSVYITTHSHGPGEGHRVRVVDGKGTITTIAGSETGGYSGDGGPATEAELNIPSSVAFGPDGNLYIGDAGNNVIRMVAL